VTVPTNGEQAGEATAGMKNMHTYAYAQQDTACHVNLTCLVPMLCDIQHSTTQILGNAQ